MANIWMRYDSEESDADTASQGNNIRLNNVIILYYMIVETFSSGY
jgi:hypothetical protein